jgi:aryl-alcohol dehydrogenase-like predicted oxidoreductase
MNYRLLGKSGLRVSDFCLGTMTFGSDWGWGADKDEAQRMYSAFREAGGNFVDTANYYTKGTSESFLGEFVQGHRESMVWPRNIAALLQARTQTQRAITARI